jgi:hypothetical protein
MLKHAVRTQFFFTRLALHHRTATKQQKIKQKRAKPACADRTVSNSAKQEIALLCNNVP